MKRRLLVLNVVLLGGAVWAGVQIRDRWRAEKAREAALMNRHIAPPPAPPFNPLPQTPAVLGSKYADIAQHTLFDASRNPVVEVVVPPPPPPPVMPPLPRFYGSYNFGDGPRALMALQGGDTAEHRAGEKLGEFQILAVSSREVVLQWMDKVIHKGPDEMEQRAPQPVQQAGGNNTAPPPPPRPVVKSALGPGLDTPQGYRECQENDSYDAGTVVQGFKKVIKTTPFGPSCRWDPVGR